MPRSTRATVFQGAQQLDVNANRPTDAHLRVKQISLQQIPIEVLWLQSEIRIAKSLIGFPDFRTEGDVGLLAEDQVFEAVQIVWHVRHARHATPALFIVGKSVPTGIFLLDLRHRDFVDEERGKQEKQHCASMEHCPFRNTKSPGHQWAPDLRLSGRSKTYLAAPPVKITS